MFGKLKYTVKNIALPTKINITKGAAKSCENQLSAIKL